MNAQVMDGRHGYFKRRLSSLVEDNREFEQWQRKIPRTTECVVKKKIRFDLFRASVSELSQVKYVLNASVQFQIKIRKITRRRFHVVVLQRATKKYRKIL